MRKYAAIKQQLVKQQATKTDKQRWKILKLMDTEY